MHKVTNIEELKAVQANELVIFIKNGNDSFYRMACIHPNKSVNGVVLINDAKLTDSKVITNYDFAKGDIGDVYIGEYDDKLIIELLIKNHEALIDKSHKEIKSLKEFSQKKYGQDA